MAEKTWLKQPTKSALLSVLKRGAKLDAKTLSKVFDGVLFKSEFKHAATGGTVSHTELSNIGTKSHTVIDAHINNALIHFTEASIDHDNILNIGTNDHDAIDLHIGDGTIHFTEGSIDHGSISGLSDNDHLQYLLRSEWLQNGFVDKDEVAIAWVDGTRTLTISPAVTSFRYYYEGILYTETGSLAAQITDTEGLWLFYIASGGAAALSTLHNPSEAQVEDAILNETLVAYVYWDATNNDGRLLDERHGSSMSPETHHYLHETRGSQYYNGMTPGDITTDQNGNTDSHAQFSITAGRFYDEDLQHDTLSRASTDTWECYYINGSGDVRWVNCEATFPAYAIGGVIAYNNAGTLTAVPSNKYILYHVFSTNIHTDAGGDYAPIVTPGIAVYNSKADAQDAALSEIQAIDFGDWPVEEVIPIATVIYHHGAAMTNGVEAAIQSTEGGGDFVDWRYVAVSGSSTSVNDHGALSGLSDVADHPGYATLDGTRPFTGTVYLDAGGTYDSTFDFQGWTVRGSAFSGRIYNTGSAVELGFYPNGGGTYDALRVVQSGVPQYISGATPYDLALADDLDDYLPLTAGSGKPLTDRLFIDVSVGSSSVVLGDYAGDDYSIIQENSPNFDLYGVRASGESIINIDAGALDNTSESRISMFRNVDTSGTRHLVLYLGDDTTTVQHSLNAGNGDVDLCQQGGDVTIHNGDLYIDDASAPGVYLREGGSATDYSRIRDEGSGFYLQKYGATGAVLAFAAITNDGTSNVQMSLFRATNTTGERDFDIYQGDGTATLQHRFRSKSGDVNLCQQAGEVTIGGTGGTQKLNVVSGHIGVDNGYTYRGKNTVGSYLDLLGVESGGYRALVGPATGARTKLRSNDSVLYPVPTSAVSDANHDASYMTCWVDESAHTLNFKVKYSGGTVKSGSIALS